MKTYIMVFFCLLGVTVSKAQDIDLNGTWKLAENKLTYTLTIGERVIDIIWDFELKDNVMNQRVKWADLVAKVVRRIIVLQSLNYKRLARPA